MFYKYAAPTALVLQMSVRQIPAREFSRGQWIILLLRSGASADRRKCFRLFSDGGALPRRQSSVGATSSEYAAPMELEIVLADVLQICRAYGAGFADERPANPGARIFKGTVDNSPSP
jgi:hypothetical protein